MNKRVRRLSGIISVDLRTHCVDIYRLLKESGLNLVLTTAKYVWVGDFGNVYYLTDGKSDYVMTIGGLPDYTPLSEDFTITRENRYDAASYPGLYTAEDFIAAAKDQVAVMRGEPGVVSGEQQYGGSPVPESEPEVAPFTMPTWGRYAIATTFVVLTACGVAVFKRKKAETRHF